MATQAFTLFDPYVNTTFSVLSSYASLKEYLLIERKLKSSGLLLSSLFLLNLS